MIPVKLFHVFLVSLFSAIVLIPPISKLAVSMGMLDLPDERKAHAHETPRLGGFAIFFAFLLALLLFADFNQQTRGFLTGAVIIFLTGLADDLVGLTPKKKFVGEIIATVCAVVVGQVSLVSLGNLFGSGEIELGPFAIPFTVLAMVGVINAINMLDGLDGLAGGVSAIALGAIGLLAFISGNHPLLLMAVALLGALLGFLKYNSYPASIFMGDAGSLLLGYSLGFFSVTLVVQGNQVISEVSPFIILAVPILDTLFVMCKRLRSGKSPFAPDRSHVHHRLLGFGFGHKASVVIVYGATYILAFFAVFCYRLADRWQAVALALVTLLFCLTSWFLEKKRLAGYFRFLRSNQPLRQTRSYRRLVGCAHRLRVAAKYLILAILLLSVFSPADPASNAPVVAGFLCVLSLFLFVARGAWNRFLLFVLYFDGAFLIYLTENFGREMTIGGVPLIWITSALFFLLFVIAGTKVFLRRRIGSMTTSPLEYLILFIVISVPLLPERLIGHHHILTVTGKSIILFVGYRLVLMREAKRNRKILAATFGVMLVIALKGLF
ncbi:MAG TPA: MraY family glycosyltransferase [Geobacteraceae bacterium]